MNASFRSVLARVATVGAMVLPLAGAFGAAGCEEAVPGGSAMPGSAATSIDLVTAVGPAPVTTAAAGSGAPLPGGTSAPAVAGGPEKFGAPLSDRPAVPLDEVVRAPEKFTATPVKVSATIATVCKKKGCWMTLAGEGGAPATTVRVTFKDYGFFVPMDTDGARVMVEGTLSVTEESEAVAKHYAEDEGKDPATVKGPLKKIAIEATGVELVRAGS